MDSRSGGATVLLRGVPAAVEQPALAELCGQAGGVVSIDISDPQQDAASKRTKRRRGRRGLKGAAAADDAPPGGGSAKPGGVKPTSSVKSSGAKSSSAAGGKWLSGVVFKNNTKYGFILQDCNQSHLFVLPTECKAFGGKIPMEGTRVFYTMGHDPATFKPRADHVRPDPSAPPPMMPIEDPSLDAQATKRAR